MTLRIGSLCSGYGGLDLAVEAATGATTAWFCEYDRDPSAILAHHWPHVPNHGDVKNTDWATVEPVDILTAGYPCQPFSHAGKRKGHDDPRHLWPDVARAISVLRPSLVVLENVRGHVSLGLDAVIGDLSGLGYDARWSVVRAADAGAPHGRARIFIVAHPDGAGPQGPQPAARLNVSDGRTSPNPGGERSHGGGDARSARSARSGWAGAARSADFATDAAGDRWGEGAAHTRRGSAGTGSGSERRPRDGWGAAPDASRERHGRGQDAGGLGRLDGADAGEARERERSRGVAVDRGAEAGPDANGRPDRGRHGEPAGVRALDMDWGAYAPAIARWEAVIGRPAPDPTEPGRNGQPRLSPVFVEWLMGLDPGHVTDPAIGLSRNAQLKALGNGVVPQQAALALRLLLTDRQETAA